MSLHIYTDGSYLPKFKEYSGWAYLITNQIENKIIYEDFGKIICESRNIDGECQAIIEALNCVSNNVKILNNIDCIKIYYDYIGLHKWITGEWKTNKNVSINYKYKVLQKLFY